jgi:phosphoserine phosphatase
MFRITAQSATPFTEQQAAFLVENTSCEVGGKFSKNAPRFQWLDGHAPTREARALASTHGLDLNAIPASWRWQDVGALASDMDSTLITIECIDEIADFAGVKKQVAHITEQAMRGELDFSQALRARVALLKGLPATVLHRVVNERLQLSPGARELIAALHRLPAKTLLVSGGFTFFTHHLQAQLGLTDTLANTLSIHDDTLNGEVLGEIVDGNAKARAVSALKATLPAGKLLIAAGDGANDLAMMALADLSVAFRAKPVVQENATVSLNHCGLDAVIHLFPAFA